MPIVTFRNNSVKESGNTSAAVAAATYMAIQHNMKILLISTSFNEDTVRECFWNDSSRKNNIAGAQKSSLQTGIEGLSKMISSSKIEPRIIRDYTKVVLNGRLDVLLGYSGDKNQYKEIQENYQQVIAVANQYYDMVMVDLDKKISSNIQMAILQISDIIIATTPQKMKEIQKVGDFIAENNIMNASNTLVVVGRYDSYLKYNTKNLSRTIFKRKKGVNAIPYNSKYYEAMQEGTVVDLFIALLQMSNRKDNNALFIDEIACLTDEINEKWEELRMKKKM